MDLLGESQLWKTDSMAAWGSSRNEPAFCIAKPHDKKPATVGNGVMVALFRETPEQVEELYKKALELGGTDEGKPGFRPEDSGSGFYAAYFRDLDGNKFNVFCIVQ